MTTNVLTIEAQKKTYKTLTDLLNAPARESMAAIARVAPAIERIARSSGIFDLVFSNAVMDVYDAKAQGKGATKKQAEALKETGVEITLRVLKYGLGENLSDMQEIIAAINGITVDELLDAYTTAEIIKMVKAIVSDQGFLSSLATLTE